jgi:hypothetical protein
MWKEALINQKDIEIDEYATRLLALYQPMARDMRFLTAVIKINGDLERMGDLAVNITQRALTLMREPAVKPLIDIPRMARPGREHGAQAPGCAGEARCEDLARERAAFRRRSGSPARRRLQGAGQLHAGRAAPPSRAPWT